MSNRFILGVSSGIFPGSSITEQEYALLTQYGFGAVEIGYEQSGPALEDRALGDQLVAVVGQGSLPVWSLHAPYRPHRDLSVLDEEQRQVAVHHAEAAFQLANRLGAQFVVIHGSQEPLASGERAARRAQARKSLAELVPQARHYQVRLALEMMPPEWLPAGVDEAFELVNGLDPAVIGFCLDTNHANLTGDLPVIVRALGTRIWNIHLSDNDGVKQRHWMPFQGVIDWQALLKALQAVHYVGPLHYELDPHPAGPERGLLEIARNFARLQALAPVE
jgi:sugar phosphate isomerase/epimerase